MSELIKMPVGQYSGVPISELPTAYCRWILTQDFSSKIQKAATARIKKLEDLPEQSINVSQHAVDRFSVRFIKVWIDYWVKRGAETKYDGIFTFLKKLSQKAWVDGKDVSKRRNSKDGIVMEYEGIKFVFQQNKKYPQYVELITVM